MEIIQDFYNDKDEQKFLQRCTEANIEYKKIESNDIQTVYQIGGRSPIAFVTYSPKIDSVGIVWFTCNFR